MSELTEIEDMLLAALRTIRTHWPMRLTQASSTQVGSASTDVVTALDKRVSFGHELTLHLNGWARVIVEDRRLSHAHLPRELGADTLGLVTFLERHAQWFSGHEAATVAVDEIKTWAHNLEQIVAPEPREWVYLGDCPFVVEDWFCAGRVRSRIGGEGDASCTDCGKVGPIAWWEAVLGIGLAPCTAGQLALEIHARLGVPVTAQTIRNWTKAGLIAVYAESQPPPQWPRYDVATTLEVVVRMGRGCASCGRPWHGTTDVCTACYVATQSADRRYAQPRPRVPAPRSLRRSRSFRVVVPDVRDDDQPGRCHFSDLWAEQCACGHVGHRSVG